MKTYIFFFSCILTLLTHANAPFEKSPDQNGSDYEFFNSTDEFVFPRHKKLDPELRKITLDMAHEDVKWLAKLIQKCVKDQTTKCPSSILFTGKNDLYRAKIAKVIAENSDLPFIRIITPFLLNSHTTFGTETIKYITKIINTTHKVIITFDGLDIVSDWEHAANYAAAVSHLLDQFKNNPNITVIGITDNPDRMPKFLKDRFAINIYFTETNATVKQKKELLHYHLKKFNNACNDKCEDYISKLLKTADPECIEAIVERANSHSSLGKEKWNITQKDLEDVINQRKETQKFFDKRK